MADSARTYGSWTTGPLLGQGAMGQVYVAHDGAGRIAALKVVHGFLARDPEFRARFAREATALAAVRGPYTAALLDAGPGDTPPWLATEYVPGPNLAELLDRDGPLGQAELRRLGGALAGALDAVHRAGLVHRDLKPSNVLMARMGPPRVIDFGIARALDGTRLTATGTAPGTAGYAAPELLTHGAATPAADVFALGAVLAHAATGRPPFGTGATDAVGYRTVHADPDLAGAPEDLLPLLTACLAKDPQVRPDPKAVARLTGHRLPRRPLSGLRLGSRTHGTFGPRRRRLLLLAGAGLAVAGTVGGLLLAPGDKPTEPPSKKESSERLPEGDGPPPARRGQVTDPLGPRTMRPLGEPVSELGEVPASGSWQQDWAQKRTGHTNRKFTHKLFGTWLTPTATVRANDKDVRAFRVADGRLLWVARPPRRGLVPCATARSAGAGERRIAVVYGTRPDPLKACDQLVVLDVATGRTVWWKSLSVRRPTEHDLETTVAVVGDRVVVSSPADAAAHRLDDGTRVWRRPWFAGGCLRNDLVAGRATVVEAALCGDGAEQRARVREIDAKDGSVRWTSELPKEQMYATVVTTDPVSVRITGNGGDDWTLRIFDERGRPGQVVKEKQPFGKIALWSGGRTFGPRGWRNTIVAEYGTADYGKGVVALDAPSGRVLWNRQPEQDTGIVGVDDRGVLVAARDKEDHGTVLLRLALADGEPTGPGAPVNTGEEHVLLSGLIVRGGRAVDFDVLDPDEGARVFSHSGAGR
ncbi:protein kinase domain-containing protein [Streptomyces sp. NPDC054863]